MSFQSPQIVSGRRAALSVTRHISTLPSIADDQPRRSAQKDTLRGASSTSCANPYTAKYLNRT